MFDMLQMILLLPFILQDNCATDSNAAQTDTDSDGVGDVCGKFVQLLTYYIKWINSVI